MGSDFHLNETFGPFKVISKRNNQILFEWTDQYTKWSGISFLSMDISPSSNESPDCADIKVQFGSGSTNPRQLPLFAKLLTPIHGLYSRMLLVSALDKILSTSA